MWRLPYTAGLPPSPRERVSKHLYPLRFHCEAACQSRFWGRVHRSSSRRHRAAPRVADRLRSRRFCARCTVYSVVQGCQKRCLYKYRFLARFLQGLNCLNMLFIKILQFVVLLRTVSESPKFLYRPLYRVCNSVYAHAILSSNICKLAPAGEAPPEPAELCVR